MKTLKVKMSEDTYECFKYLQSIDGYDVDEEIETIVLEIFEEQKRIKEIIEKVKNS